MSNSVKDRAYVIAIQNGYKLKWHKFLIYWGLWVSALSALSQTAGLMTGSQYGENAREVYNYYAGLEKVDVVFSILYLLLAIITIVGRFKLANFSLSAFKYLTAIYILPPITFALYLVFFYFCTNVLEPSDVASLLGNFIGNGIVLALTQLYYRKRKDLFE